MPELKSGEYKSDYVSRCISVAVKEGKSQKEAVGYCYGLYRYLKKRAFSKKKKS